MVDWFIFYWLETLFYVTFDKAIKFKLEFDFEVWNKSIQMFIFRTVMYNLLINFSTNSKFKIKPTM